jgi:aminoglycoside 6-adenylyltransferase
LSQTALTYEQLERNFVAWARAQPDILAAVVVGSRARTEHPADEWSDLDLILFTTDPSAYVSDTGWLNEIGEVWVSLLNRSGQGHPEWLVLFAGGVKGDFLFATTPKDMSLPEMIAAFPYQDVLGRGMRVLFAKNRAAAQPLQLKGAPPTHPTPTEFLAAIHHALIYAERTAKLLRRGDLWRAKLHCDCELKQDLLKMLEWHARACHGLDYDTWYDGRFLNEWADARALEVLPHTFATYDTGDLWRALFATLDLFRWLAIETAERLGYAYPTEADTHVTQRIRRLAK